MRSGDYARAVSFTEQAVAQLRELELDPLLGWALCNLAFSLLLDGRDEEAAAASKESLDLVARISEVVGIVWNIVLIASVATRRGDAKSDARLLGSAEALREPVGFVLSGAEAEVRRETETDLRRALTAADFEAAFAQGQALSTEEAVAAALRAGVPLAKPEASPSGSAAPSRRVNEL
jgi:hypothetical protein